MCSCVSACCLYVQVWAVSGELRDFSGGFQGSSPHRWATPAASHQTPLTTRSAQVIYSVHMHIFYTWIYFNWSCSLPLRRWSGLPGHFSVRSVRVQETKKCKGKRRRWRDGKGVLSTALSSSHRLPFICSQLLRMHCSRWAVPPVPTSPWPTCKDWALYCAVLRRFFQQRLMCMTSHRWAAFLETMIWRTWCWR